MTGARRSPGKSNARSRLYRDPVEMIEGRWTWQILLCLKASEYRFSELRAAIPGISSNILTDRLRALETAGFVQRRRLPPPRSGLVYVLGPRAVGLGPALEALTNWQTLNDERAQFRATR